MCVDEALKDPDWLLAMQEKLNNFTYNDMWVLEPPPKNKNIIGTKWVFRNKEDEHGLVVHNKARLVVKGYSQVKRLDFGETFTPVARLKAIWLKKALYGLKQAPRAWYERLSGFLVKQDFKRGMVDTTLFTKDIDVDLFICQIYVDDIIFGSTNDAPSHEIATMMSKGI
jgi:hypothetical protein